MDFCARMLYNKIYKTIAIPHTEKYDESGYEDPGRRTSAFLASSG